jgi:peptidoglycan/xylan/chitin deacetylase (PgdA/CDA1 family)
MDNGSFIVSLDFELLWGLRYLPNAENFKQSVLEVEKVIPQIVDLFNKYSVNATFATVGLVFCGSKREIYEYAPALKPGYKDKSLSPYENNYLESLSPNNDKLHSAEFVVEYLKKQHGIEMGTHTFCHYYCWADGQTAEEFEADITAAVNVASAKGIALSSIVFPRNEVNDEYLKICAKYGIKSYRGNPANFFNKSGKITKFLHLNRILRFTDTYFNFGNDTTYSYEEMHDNQYMINVKASRFLKPYSKQLAMFDKFKIKRIKREMTRAAKKNRVYHLWWHPHNFGINQKENLSVLEKILQHYSSLNRKFGMQSYTMAGLSNLLNK